MYVKVVVYNIRIGSVPWQIQTSTIEHFWWFSRFLKNSQVKLCDLKNVGQGHNV